MGLVYLLHRYYDPATAQFLTVDPALALTGTPYGYAGNSPFLYSDPTGLWPDIDVDWGEVGKWTGIGVAAGATVLCIIAEPCGLAEGGGAALAAVGAGAGAVAAEAAVPTIVGGEALAAGGIGGGTLGAVGGLTLNMSKSGSGSGECPDAVSPGETSVTKSNSPVWKKFRSFRGQTKTNGLSGKDRQYYEWDNTHSDIEVYNRRGEHMGSMDPVTGKMTKLPVPGRRIDI